MQHHAAFHQVLHCLQKYSFRGFPEYKGLLKSSGAIAFQYKGYHHYAILNIVDLLSKNHHFAGKSGPLFLSFSTLFFKITEMDRPDKFRITISDKGA